MVVNSIDVDLAMGYSDVELGVQTIQPGVTVPVGKGITATCSDDGPLCVFIVNLKKDGSPNYTSLGGKVMVRNTGAVVETLTAIALSGAADGALVNQKMAPDAPNNDLTEVERDPDGVIKITLTHQANDADEVEYDPAVDVDPGHGIDNWMGRTLTRNNGTEAMMNTDAVPATEMDVATFYTDIDAAEAGKWMVTGEMVPQTTDMAFLIDPDQEEEAFTTAFTGNYVRADGTKIHGTFTCDTEAEAECTTFTAPTETNLEGNLVLPSRLSEGGWTFESTRDDEPEGWTPDADYMYFGYWLNSPVDPSADPMAYEFATFSGGNAPFTVGPELTNDSHALKATYEGGAAGMYVTRELRLKDGEVDPLSPGSYGGFTANAMLNAYFGAHADFEAGDDADANPSKQNMVDGTITNFMDGDMDLDFEVEFELSLIADSSITDGVATATFGNPNDNNGMGTWDAQFYGPNADTDATDEVINSTLPSGVAGQFEVGSDYTKVVGAFAAE